MVQEIFAQFFEQLAAFCDRGGVWVYVFIFAGKLLEVSLATLRVVLINRGERVKGSLLAILEVSLWLIIFGVVLSGYQQDVLKAVFYALAFASGNFMGSWLDDRLAFGLSSVQIVVSGREEAELLKAHLKEQSFGVTTIDVRGKDESERYMLLLVLKRKLLKTVVAEITTLCESAMVTVSDVKTVRGGYLRSPANKRGSIIK